jgi:hypothetical protein
VNAQFPITTTPKYNFPPLISNLQLPRKFIELSIHSLEWKQNPQGALKKGKATQSTLHQRTPLQRESPEKTFVDESLVKLTPDSRKTPIVAIDVSSIRLGETQAGTLIAVRGAVVWKQFGRYRYLRLGPFPFHITKRNEKEVRCLLHLYRQSERIQENVVPNALFVQAKLTTLLERWIQASVSHTNHDSIILWDGSLIAGTPATSIQTMGRLLKRARDNGNNVLAFSKMTRLLFLGRRLTDFVAGHPSPCLLRMQDYPTHLGSMRLMGSVYVAKLTGKSCAFRLDADRNLTHPEVVEAVQKLLGNDLISQSYPDTLRLAHIMSTFTAIEVLGMQRCIAKQTGVEIVARPSIRRVLFGPFGKEG